MTPRRTGRTAPPKGGRGRRAPPVPVALRPPGSDDQACSTVREVLSRVGDKWSVLVVALLGKGSMRFNALRREVEGVSQRMLTLTLRGLERDGLVTRSVTPTVPPRVDYALTPLGFTLLETVSHLLAWAQANSRAVRASQEAFDAREAAAPVALVTGRRIAG